MQIPGVIVKSNGSTCQVHVHRNSACGQNCGASCTMCSVAKEMEVLADSNGYELSVGDKVIIESGHNNNVLGLAALLYLFPLVTAAVGYYFGEPMGGEMHGIAGAFIGGAAGYIPSLIINRQMAKKAKPSHIIKSVE